MATRPVWVMRPWPCLTNIEHAMSPREAASVIGEPEQANSRRPIRFVHETLRDVASLKRAVR